MRSLLLLAVLLAACGTTGGAQAGATPMPPDPMNMTFTLDRGAVTLVGGRAERTAAPGSATKIVTTLSDLRATGDVDGDGRPDTVVILADQPGGSGTFSYLAALVSPVKDVVAVSNAVLLGDRVTVTGVRIDGRTIVVEMLDRAPGQPMTSSPTLSVTKRFTVDAGALRPQ